MTERYYRNRRILQGYNHLLKQIDDLACLCAELETNATKINQTLSDAPSPSNHEVNSRVEGDYIRIAEMKARLEKAIIRRNKIDAALKRLSYKHQVIVREIDINGQSISKTAKKLKMNYNYLIGLHVKVVGELKI